MDAGLIPAELLQCAVVESRQVGAYRLISFVAPQIANLAHPGQFLMIRLAGSELDPLLPRPMGIHNVESDLVTMLIDPVGKGTARPAAAGIGDRVSVLGPLGIGFRLEGDAPAVLVGGGIGISPLKLLARALAAGGREVRCLLGFRTRKEAVATELFSGVRIDVITEDGSIGRLGLVSDPLPGCLAREPGKPAPEIFACGPSPMLAAIARIARECGNPAQVSVESHMACGIGSCQGCVIRGAGGYLRVCSDGPVFDVEDISWQ